MIQAKSEVNHKKQITNLKKTHRFSRAERFQLSTYTNTDFNYNLEYRKSKRACSFGIGNRPIMINDLNSPNPDRYYIGGKMLKAQSSKKGVSIGYSRQNVVFRSLNTEVQRKALLPSPCQYKIQKQKGKAYTLGIKLPVQMYNILRQSSPAPGDYKAITMNKQGKYAISKVKNPRRVSFGSKTRTLSHNERQTGPGSYDIFNMDSKFSERNVKNLRKNHAKQFGTSQRKLFEDRQKSQTPGPGYYQSLKYIGHQPEEKMIKLFSHISQNYNMHKIVQNAQEEDQKLLTFHTFIKSIENKTAKEYKQANLKYHLKRKTQQKILNKIKIIPPMLKDSMKTHNNRSISIHQLQSARIPLDFSFMRIHSETIPRRQSKELSSIRMPNWRFSYRSDQINNIKLLTDNRMKECHNSKAQMKQYKFIKKLLPLKNYQMDLEEMNSLESIKNVNRIKFHYSCHKDNGKDRSNKRIQFT